MLLWQQGKDKWHVDAPVTVVGDRVLVASAFLDKEKLGDRALFCLDAKTGDIVWRKPLKINPWGGPSVVGKTVVVSGSTIGYDPKALEGRQGRAGRLRPGRRQGEVAQGDHRRRGVLRRPDRRTRRWSTATDGKVRAFDLATGERRWIYDAKTPFFAPAGRRGRRRLRRRSQGRDPRHRPRRRRREVEARPGRRPGVKAPGMIYGGPVVQGGRLYVATCNLADNGKGTPTVVVCIGEK